MEFSDIELGPKMQTCSERERKFVWFYVTGDGNASQAARDAGYADPGGESSSIRVQAHELMHRERVLEAIEEVGKKSFRNQLVPALRANKALIENDKHPDHAKTVHTTLARLGLGERTGVDVSVTGEVTVNHTDQAIEHLRLLKALEVPRPKLEEIFGFSGLTRYERMLEQVQMRQVTVIDHE